MSFVPVTVPENLVNIKKNAETGRRGDAGGGVKRGGFEFLL